MQLNFWSTYSVVGQMYPFCQQKVKDEPQFFSASWDFAAERGGPITRDFLKHAAIAVGPRHDGIVDSRCHMLMPGWYPCIPGWHLDDVPRTRPDGQPDHCRPSYLSQHLCAVVGDASLTQFLAGRIELDDIPVGKGVCYGEWNTVINNRIANGQLKPNTIGDGNIVQFDWQTFHRGMPATKDGWRMFIRLSWNTKRPITNEIRHQTQVYLPAHEAGW